MIKQLSILMLSVILVLTLGACAGGDSGDTNVSNNTNNQADNAGDASANAGVQTVNASNPNTSANMAVAQATEIPLAATVNGDPITMAEFERERARWLTGLDVEPATAAGLDANVLQLMIDQKLIEQAATREGIVVTDEEIDAELALQADLAAANDITLEEIITAQLYTMDEYRAVLRGTLLAQKLSDVVANVSPYAAQVHSRHILVKDEATARALIQQIQGGADFAALAAQYSFDGSTAQTGGDLSWVSEGDLLQKEVEDAIFALEPGQLAPEPVQSSLGYHVIQVLERVEDRPLSAAALAEKRQQVFLAWLDSQRQTAVIERFVGVNN
ncbi:MAG: peptidylprolyl isomerase [Anaerolineae bacterium]|nr:peptidylprolyl isomerase [Anaerolineae bacterium]